MLEHGLLDLVVPRSFLKGALFEIIDFYKVRLGLAGLLATSWLLCVSVCPAIHADVFRVQGNTAQLLLEHMMCCACRYQQGCC